MSQAFTDIKTIDATATAATPGDDGHHGVCDTKCIKELVAAYEERAVACGVLEKDTALIDGENYRDYFPNVQQGGRAFQEKIEALIYRAAQCAPEIVPQTNFWRCDKEDGIVLWHTSDYADYEDQIYHHGRYWPTKNIFKHAIGEDATSWRRRPQVEAGGMPIENPMAAEFRYGLINPAELDIIGPWFYEDCQKILDLLREVILYQPDSAAGTSKMGSGSTMEEAERKFSSEPEGHGGWLSSAGTEIENIHSYLIYRSNSTLKKENAPKIACDVDIYFGCRPFSVFSTNIIFDANGDGVVEGFAVQKTVGYDGYGTIEIKLGSLEKPAWCATGQSRGYAATGDSYLTMKLYNKFKYHAA